MLGIKKLIAKYLLYVGLPLFVLHFSSEAFDRLDTIEGALHSIQSRAQGN